MSGLYDFAEIMMMTERASSASARRVRSTSKPCMSSMMMSQMMTAGRWACASAMPSAPCRAVSTRKPRFVKTKARSSRSPSSLSITRRDSPVAGTGLEGVVME